MTNDGAGVTEDADERIPYRVVDDLVIEAVDDRCVHFVIDKQSGSRRPARRRVVLFLEPIDQALVPLLLDEHNSARAIRGGDVLELAEVVDKRAPV
jgi:hypothetical protein